MVMIQHLMNFLSYFKAFLFANRNKTHQHKLEIYMYIIYRFFVSNQFDMHNIVVYTYNTGLVFSLLILDLKTYMI